MVLPPRLDYRHCFRWVIGFALLAVGLGSLQADELRPRMRDFIGLNGHTVQFKPDLYRPTCGLVRDYHPVDWDLGKQTDELPNFPLAKNRVDWNQLYGTWRTNHWTIDACLMVESIQPAHWHNLPGDAQAYGKYFAQTFGPSSPRHLVDSVEIGNEPGQWSDADYATLFKAFAVGVRSGDPKLKIVTCNLTTGKSGNYAKSVDCVAQNPELFDVLNIHSYAQLEGWPTWRRSFPEDPNLRHYLSDIAALCQWRDQQAPNKPVWITEFGYDSSTKPAEPKGDFAQWVGVTDVQQAQWIVRSLLGFSALPVERAYLYFFNDEDQPRLHASSGITRHFQPKPSYHALAHLQQVLGDCRFRKVVTAEPADIRVHEYQGDSHKIIWVVWSPTGDGRQLNRTLNHVPGKLVNAQSMPLTANPAPAPVVTQGRADQIEIQVNESPIYLTFEQ